MRPILVHFALLSAVAAVNPAEAKESERERTVQIFVETQSLPASDGSLSTLEGEYKAVLGKTTFVFAPQYGWRDDGTVTETAFGLSASLYHEFSGGFSTRTMIAASEDEPVFAQRQFAQDVTFGLSKNLTATIGGRWAQYFGSRDVYFLSAGARYYFDWGSISYRLSHVTPDQADSYFAHLANISLNDSRGAGKTQLWLSSGESSYDVDPLQNFSGDDFGAALRRLQPLTEDVNLIASAGYESYDRPTGRTESISFGLGIEVGL